MDDTRQAGFVPTFPRAASRSQRFWTRLGLNLIRRRLRTYQPAIDEVHDTAFRQTIARWQAIEHHLTRIDPGTLLDMGCAQGYFTLRAAKTTRALCLGVDADPTNLWFAVSQMFAQESIERCGFICCQFDDEFIDAIGIQDVVISLAVFHHIFQTHGTDHATVLMRRVRARTAKAMFFEMGQSNETLEPWARSLPDMGPDPNVWVSQWLQACGWADPRLIGEFPNHSGEVTRGLWLCEA